MQAIVVEEFGPVDTHAMKDVPTPSPGAGQILIRIRAIGLNFPDGLIMQGNYQARPALPFVPGRDAAGIVEAVGEGVSGFVPGDRVVCQVFAGAFAEFVAAPVNRCFKLGPRTSFEDAAAVMTVFNTAYVAIHIRAEARKGQTAVVTGAAGGVGLALVQLLKVAGLQVIAVVSSAEKAELVIDNGAHSVVRSDALDWRDRIHAEAMKLTGGAGADLVFDTVGGDSFAYTLRTLGFGGKMLVIGFASAELPVVKATYVLNRNIAVIGAPLDGYFDHAHQKMEHAIKEIHRLIENGEIRPNITRTLPFDGGVKQGLLDIMQRRAVGKVVVSLP